MNTVLILAALLFFTSCGESNKQRDTSRPEVDYPVNKVTTETTPVQAKAENKDLIVYLTSAQFRELIFDYRNNTQWKYNGTEPAIVDFYADWCRPCKMMEPTLRKVAAEYEGRVKVYKVDTEAEKEVAAKLQIMSLPSILFIPGNGDQPQMAQGALPKASFDQMINEFLLAK